MNGIIIAVIAIALWIAIIIVLKKKYPEKVSLMGPVLLLKTKRGRKLIEKISRKKFWKHYARICIFVSYSLLVFSFAMIIWEAYMAMYVPKSRAPSPVEALGIPGINPVIPITYGIVGLIVAIVVHEGAHGIMASWQKLKIMSMGIALFIVPVGAFVEPDEEELTKAPRYKRVKVFSAGPSTNIIVGLISLMIFLGSVSAISPKHEGVVVMDELISSPFHYGDVIERIGNYTVKSSSDIYDIKLPPAQSVVVSVYRGERKLNINYTAGLYIVDVLEGTPAISAGIEKGSIIVSVDGNPIYNYKSFLEILGQKKAGETIELILYKDSSYKHYNLTLMDKYDYYSKQESVCIDEYKGKGFMGVSVAYMGLSLVGCSEILQYIGSYSLQSPFQSFLKFISLPFLGFEPLPKEIQSLYSTPLPLFWEMVHYSYWIAWLNILVGLTNLLPAVPLDGGYMVRDALAKILEKRKNGEKLADRITTSLAFVVLFLILWIFIVPRF